MGHGGLTLSGGINRGQGLQFVLKPGVCVFVCFVFAAALEVRARTFCRLGRYWTWTADAGPQMLDHRAAFSARKPCEPFLYLWVRVPKRTHKAFLTPSMEVLDMAPDSIHLIKQSPSSSANEVEATKSTLA